MLKLNFINSNHRQVILSLAMISSILGNVDSSYAMDPVEEQGRHAPNHTIPFDYGTLAERSHNECTAIRCGFRDYQASALASAWESAYTQSQEFLLPFQDLFYAQIDLRVTNHIFLGRQASIIKNAYVDLLEIFSTPELAQPAQVAVKKILSPAVTGDDLIYLFADNSIEFQGEIWTCLNLDQLVVPLQGIKLGKITALGEPEEISDKHGKFDDFKKFLGWFNDHNNKYENKNYKGKYIAIYKIDGIAIPLYLIR